MQHIVMYLLEHHHALSEAYFDGKGSDNAQVVQDAVRLASNIALTAAGCITDDKTFGDWSYWMSYMHKPDHATNDVFFSKKVEQKLSEISSNNSLAGPGDGLFATEDIKAGDIVGFFVGKWVDKGTWPKKQLTFHRWGGPEGKYEFKMNEFPPLWNRHLT